MICDQNKTLTADGQSTLLFDTFYYCTFLVCPRISHLSLHQYK